MPISNGSYFPLEFFNSVEVSPGDNGVNDTAVPDIPARYMDPCMQERVTN